MRHVIQPFHLTLKDISPYKSLVNHVLYCTVAYAPTRRSHACMHAPLMHTAHKSTVHSSQRSALPVRPHAHTSLKPRWTPRRRKARGRASEGATACKPFHSQTKASGKQAASEQAYLSPSTSQNSNSKTSLPCATLGVDAPPFPPFLFQLQALALAPAPRAMVTNPHP